MTAFAKLIASAGVMVFLSTGSAQSHLHQVLAWQPEQEPKHTPCTVEDIAFVTAPEQVRLQKTLPIDTYVRKLNERSDSANAKTHRVWQCEVITAEAYHGGKVISLIWPPEYDDAIGYILIKPVGSSAAHFIDNVAGDHLLWGHESELENLSAFNDLLFGWQVSSRNASQIDWLGLSLAYLALLHEAPVFQDRHYEQKTGEIHFTPYTVPGFLKEIPKLEAIHLRPTLDCEEVFCKVQFYFKTDPVSPIRKAFFRYGFADQQLLLEYVVISEYTRKAKR